MSELDIFVPTILLTFALAIGAILLYYKLMRLVKQAENVLKDPFSTILTPENVTNLLETIINNPKYQNFLVASGNFLGAGVKNGFGNILGGSGKKLSLEGVIKEALGGLIQQRVNQGGFFNQRQPTKTINTENSQSTSLGVE